MDIGFSSNLLCSSCRELKEFNLEALEDDCEKCCQADGVNSDENVIKNRLHTQPSLILLSFLLRYSLSIHSAVESSPMTLSNLL